MNRRAAIKSDIAKKFKHFMKNGRIMLFGAPCGFGKTTVAEELLRNSKANTYEVSAEEIDFEAISANDKWEVLLVDRLQMLQNREKQERLCEIIRDNPHRRFIFLTRGMTPSWLIQFQFSGLMIVINTEMLFFDRETAAAVFKSYDVNVSETSLSEIMRDSMGYPLAVSIVARRMSAGADYDGKMADEILREIYMYYDDAIFCRFDIPVRRFLLELAPFEEFCTELAKMVSGDSHAGDILMSIQKNTCMLIADGLDKFHFWPIFRDFLMWEQQREYSSEQQRALYSRGGLYYELNEDYAKALEYYTKSGDQNKASELLAKVMELHPGMGHYENMEGYYLQLSDEQIGTSPALMQGKSMLCALRADYEGSERWYSELERFAEVRKKSDAAAKEAKSRLVWLNIALPQRGVTGIIDAITAAFALISSREIKLPPFSVTSALPSIMNGGKDFSEWSKKDDLLYATMKIPVEAVLGKDGVGLAECAITESKFEKGEDVSSRMLTLVSKISEIQSRGTADIEFALVGLLARSQADTGRPQDARRTLKALRERFSERGYERFLPNIDAMLCRIAMMCGNMEYVDEWYRDKAPKDTVNIRIMKRYLYFTQAMAEIMRGDERAALMTLSPLGPYCRICSRNIDTIHMKVLCALAKRGLGEEAWREDIASAVEIAEKYSFVRTLGMYGTAVLPMLEELAGTKKSSYLSKTIKTARRYGVYYPDFMKPKNRELDKLTEAEMQVLRLLCADKSNSEIGEILNIRLATVKSHVSHILQKLGVSRRGEAKTAANRLNILH